MGFSSSSFGVKFQYSWYESYMAALFEAEPSRLNDRISEAEKVLLARERELFSASQSQDEQRAINVALHALRALRSCYRSHNGDFAAA